MKSSDYWKQRFTQLERSQTASSAKTSAEVQELYNSAKAEIENRLYAWYGRLAANNGVSMSEARRLLKADELDEFHWSVQQYIKRGKECAVNNQKWFKELENASAKFHITRLEALETNLKANFEILAAQKDGLVSEAVKDAYRTGYYQSCFEVQRGFNVGFDIGAIDEGALNKLIRKPWAADGYNFSERIWRDKTKLINLMHSELTRSVMLGSSPDKAVKAISKAMDTSLYNAKRLVMTENSYFHALGEQEMYSEFGFDKYEVVAAFDASRKTCELCADMDGKVFLTKDFAPGLNANPFHPNCHCTTIPYFDDDEDEVRFTRLADGKGAEVPSDMRYEEWKREFVTGRSNSEIVNSLEKDVEKSLDISGESGIIETGLNMSANSQKSPDFAKYTVVDNLSGVEELKKYILNELKVPADMVKIDKLRNVQVAKPFVECLKKIQNECGLKMPGIIATDIIEGDECCIASFKPSENMLYISSRFFNSEEALLDTLREWADNDIMPKQCRTIQYIAEHEAAHIRIPYDVIVAEEARKIFRKRKLSNDNDTRISEYFADAVAIFRTSKNPDANVVKAIEYLRERGVVI